MLAARPRRGLSLAMAASAAAVVLVAVAGTTNPAFDGDRLREVAVHLAGRIGRPVKVQLAPSGRGLALVVLYVPGAEERRTEALLAGQMNAIMEQAAIRYVGFVDEVVVRAVPPEELLGPGAGGRSKAGSMAELLRRLDRVGVLAYGDYHWPKKVPAYRTWKCLLIHHSAADVGSVESIDRGHRLRGPEWKGIAYDFLIGNGNGAGDGEVFATFRWNEQEAGAHAGVEDYNQLAIGICLVGDFSNEEELAVEWKRRRRAGSPPEPARPSQRQMDSLRILTLYLLLKFNLPPESILGHRDVKQDICPGGNFPMDEFVADIRRDLVRMRPAR